MPRWIAFDQQTSSLLRSSLAQGTTVETFGRGPLDYALAKPGAVVTILPSAGGAHVGIAVFRRPKKRKPAAPVVLPQRNVTRATGFLGLSDEAVIDEEPVQQKKGWWRRFWDE